MFAEYGIIVQTLLRCPYTTRSIKKNFKLSNAEILLLLMFGDF